MPPQGPNLVLPSYVLSGTHRLSHRCQLGRNARLHGWGLSSAIISSSTYPDVELDVLVRDRLNIETNSWNGADRLAKLELVQNSWTSHGEFEKTHCYRRERFVHKTSYSLVFPAESKPSIKMRISLLPKSFFRTAPMIECACQKRAKLFLFRQLQQRRWRCRAALDQKRKVVLFDGQAGYVAQHSPQASKIAGLVSRGVLTSCRSSGFQNPAGQVL